jgi:hypothetical protein
MAIAAPHLLQISNDVERFITATIFIPFIFLAPLQVGFSVNSSVSNASP